MKGCQLDRHRGGASCPSHMEILQSQGSLLHNVYLLMRELKEIILPLLFFSIRVFGLGDEAHK